METQPERTGLAWQRTALGVLGIAGLIGHGALLGRSPALLLLAGAVALLGLALLLVTPRRYRGVLRAVAAGGTVTGRRTVPFAVGVVVVAALASGCAVLVYA